ILNESIHVPLATFETPLWPSVQRGAKVSMACDGIAVTIAQERMTRSVIFEAFSAQEASRVAQALNARRSELVQVVQETSRFAQFIDLHFQIVGSLLYVRFEFLTGDASGHNMATKASDHLMQWILDQYPALRYVSVSGNYCTDKKVSAVNGILGRGKYVIAELTIPREICQRFLRTTPEQIVDLHIKKNLIGTMLAGGLRSANAHFANILLAVYLATGQDAANIIEGSQGFVHTECRSDSLYFSVTLPNVIVGTVGNGKDLDFVQKNLQAMGCLDERATGENARRLAAITAAAVLCGELSLLAALTNPGELVRSHLVLER
ncbi:MAG: hydroxymethylglutaryl-CoA reductase, partial [Gammaproteobacteria bacterium]|nr:hydroxymethylglutaryl-CoA reductase [Gammaproteobacteria bacterium]